MHKDPQTLSATSWASKSPISVKFPAFDLHENKFIVSSDALVQDGANLPNRLQLLHGFLNLEPLRFLGRLSRFSQTMMLSILHQCSIFPRTSYERIPISR